ncbi:MAG TPA: hypothetical protein VMZ52_10445 [Bryobacteraceae bacterium]|nr:hypothetical protein [Bryobacteraceae bacterium]
MKSLAVAVVTFGSFAILLGRIAADADGGKAEYVGGTVAALEAKADGRIRTTDDKYFSFRVKSQDVLVPYGKINLIEYGMKADRRYVMAVLVSPMFILTKQRQHFLTIGYQDEQGGQQAMVFRIPKDKIRSLLVSLEARTGRKVQFQDDEARKAGKG